MGGVGGGGRGGGLGSGVNDDKGSRSQQAFALVQRQQPVSRRVGKGGDGRGLGGVGGAVGCGHFVLLLDAPATGQGFLANGFSLLATV